MTKPYNPNEGGSYTLADDGAVELTERTETEPAAEQAPQEKTEDQPE